jgi:hypothetical protein
MLGSIVFSILLVIKPLTIAAQTVVSATGPLVAAIMMATVAERLTAGLITPVFTKFKLDTFYLLYAGWAVGGLLVWFTKANVFADYVPDPLTGQVLTAVVAGGGGNLLHDLFDKAPAAPASEILKG